MIQAARGLNDSALEAIAGLERRVLATDGGRLKLEWGNLRSRPHDHVRDLLWWEDTRLLGFLGIYGFHWPRLELAGMVAPEARRRGIGRALLGAALVLCREHGGDNPLLVVPRNAGGGTEFARALGLPRHHSEHVLRLAAAPAPNSESADIELTEATGEDIPALSRLLDDGFHDGGPVDEDRLSTERSRTLLITQAGEAIGTLAVSREAGRASIYGFVVASGHRGQGIGRQALRHVCREAFAAGADDVTLEVEVDNDGALGLYTSVGFTPMATDDYYELLLQPASGGEHRPVHGREPGQRPDE